MQPISKIIDGRRVIVKKPELLAPAGNLEKLKTAIIYGADAVFIGGKEFSLRSQASNFSIEDIKEAVQFANQYGAKIHVTCNIILHHDNLEGIKEYLQALDDAGVTAIIVADPYIMNLAKSMDLKLEVHVSTQMSVTNSSAVKFFEDMGMDRVVLGRETTFEDLKDIRKNAPDIDLEYFIHGAMCISYSGRCMLSNYYSRRDANRGGCSQSCRWYYDLEENGQSINEDFPFTMSSKDMCLIHHIGELIECGVDSFKIEGRMKSVHYIATVVSTYRKLIDTYCADPDHFTDSKKYEDELQKAANRAFCHGFFYDNPGVDEQLYNLRDEHPTQEFVMRVLGYDQDSKRAKIEQRNYFKVGDKIEIFSPSHSNIYFTVDKIYNEDNELVEVANHPMEILYVEIDYPVLENDMGRKVNHGK
ncbi:peptidase U32 family protein [Catenibacterium faecis]|uniref:U32 family peptidase n=2 Tax=Catenibacterium faecis TaxID=2764323 RepID=A0ABR7KAP2_9FIRM|nr:U32 family peptidase [Catenibacterium faecis]MBC6009770.1 U32 family peptidase [Catenibacterium faecis]